MNRPFNPADHPPLVGKAVAPALVPAIVGATVTYRFRTSVCPHHDTATATSCDECDRGYMDCVCVDCGELRPLDGEGCCRKCHDSNTLSSADFDLLYPTRIAPLPEGWSRGAY